MAKLAKLADAAAVAFGLLGLYVFVFGELVLHLGPFPVIRAHGAGRLFFVAFALIAIRHVLMPRRSPAPPSDARDARPGRLGPRCGDGSRSRRASASSSWRTSRSSRSAWRPAMPGFIVSPDPVGNLPARYDAGWYGEIALEGYSFQGRFDRQQTLAFFPAFPMLARIVGYPLGAFAPGVPRDRRLARVLWAGVIISIAAFAWGAVYLWRLARDTIGEAHAFDAVALAAAYPFALFFSAAYSESLFLLGAVAAIYHFRRNELLAAAAWGLLVGLTRPNGCFLSVVLALLVLDAAIAKSRNPQITKSPKSPDHPIPPVGRVPRRRHARSTART